MDPFVEQLLKRRHLGPSYQLESIARVLDSVTHAAIVAPHSDDAEISMGALICWLVERGIDVTVLLLYAGFRSGGTTREGWSELQSTQQRVAEAEAACRVTGAKLRFLDVSAYRRRHQDYLPSDEDIEVAAIALQQLTPQLVFVPPQRDLHKAHRAARELMALATYQAGLESRFISYESPWGSIIPTHYFAFSRELQQRKQEAVAQFASQLQFTDYQAWVHHTERAHLAKVRELITGHSSESCSHIDGAAGVELFRLESVDEDYPDPVSLVLSRQRERAARIDGNEPSSSTAKGLCGAEE